MNITEIGPNEHPRYRAFDLIRAIAIICVLAVHRIHYTWKLWEQGDYFSTEGFQKVLVILTILLFMLAGIFYVISGTVNVLSLSIRLSQSSPNQKKIFFHYYLKGIILIGLNYIHRILFANGFIPSGINEEPEFAVGFITGWIKYGRTIQFYPKMVTEPGTLFILGLILIVNTLIVQITYSKGEHSLNYPKLQKSFKIIAIIIFLISPFAKFILLPYYDTLYENQHFLFTSFIGHFSLEFSPFPYLAFALYGGNLALVVMTDTEFRIKFKQIRRDALFWLILGTIFIFLFDSDTTLGDYLIKAGINYLLIFIYSAFILLAIRSLDYNLKENKFKPPKTRFSFISLYGNNSLTLYFYEGIIATIFGRILDLIFSDGWRFSLYAVIAFTLGYILFWGILLRVWQLLKFRQFFERIRRKNLL